MSKELVVLQPWNVLRSAYRLETPWLRVRQDTCQLSNGSVIDDYYVVERRDVVGIVCVTAKNEVVFNRQYKHGISEIVREIPAGMIDDGEDPLEAATRELEEESGYQAKEWIHLNTFIASPSSDTNRFHIFLARHAVATGIKMDHPREEIVNDLIPLSEIESHIQSGDIQVMWTIVALDRARAWLHTNTAL